MAFIADTDILQFASKFSHAACCNALFYLQVVYDGNHPRSNNFNLVIIRLLGFDLCVTPCSVWWLPSLVASYRFSENHVFANFGLHHHKQP